MYKKRQQVPKIDGLKKNDNRIVGTGKGGFSRGMM